MNKAIALTLSSALFSNVAFGHVAPATIWEDRHGSVRPTRTPSSLASFRTVVHIQDIHRNEEAQRNIAITLSEMASKNPNLVIGLEGAFHPIDLDGIRRNAHKPHLEKAADYLLRTHQISGPVFQGLTSPRSLRFIGVDDRHHYDANVAALHETTAAKDRIRWELDAEGTNLRHVRSRLNPSLKKLLNQRDEYDRSRLSIGDYLKALAPQPTSNSETDQFLKALEIEKSLDFKKVEQERSLAREQMKNNHFDRKVYPNLDRYLRYAELSEKLDATALFNEMHRLENSQLNRLAKTPKEIKAVQNENRYRLSKKLVDFELTEVEWLEYLSLKNVPSPGTGEGTGVRGFEKFYEHAEARNQAMADNLVAEMDERKSNFGVLVAGGFHAKGIEKALLARNITVISYVPKITKVDDGSRYLDAFAQQKTPLEKLFQNEKIFLAQAPVSKPVRAGLLPAILVSLSFLTGTAKAGDATTDFQTYSPDAPFKSVVVEKQQPHQARLTASTGKSGLQFDTQIDNDLNVLNVAQSFIEKPETKTEAAPEKTLPPVLFWMSWIALWSLVSIIELPLLPGLATFFTPNVGLPLAIVVGTGVFALLHGVFKSQSRVDLSVRWLMSSLILFTAHYATNSFLPIPLAIVIGHTIWDVISPPEWRLSLADFLKLASKLEKKNPHRGWVDKVRRVLIEPDLSHEDIPVVNEKLESLLHSKNAVARRAAVVGTAAIAQSKAADASQVEKAIKKLEATILTDPDIKLRVIAVKSLVEMTRNPLPANMTNEKLGFIFLDILDRDEPDEIVKLALDGLEKTLSRSPNPEFNSVALQTFFKAVPSLPESEATSRINFFLEKMKLLTHKKDIRPVALTLIRNLEKYEKVFARQPNIPIYIVSWIVFVISKNLFEPDRRIWNSLSNHANRFANRAGTMYRSLLTLLTDEHSIIPIDESNLLLWLNNFLPHEPRDPLTFTVNEQHVEVLGVLSIRHPYKSDFDSPTWHPWFKSSKNGKESLEKSLPNDFDSSQAESLNTVVIPHHGNHFFQEAVLVSEEGDKIELLLYLGKPTTVREARFFLHSQSGQVQINPDQKLWKIGGRLFLKDVLNPDSSVSQHLYSGAPLQVELVGYSLVTNKRYYVFAKSGVLFSIADEKEAIQQQARMQQRAIEALGGVETIQRALAENRSRILFINKMNRRLRVDLPQELQERHFMNLRNKVIESVLTRLQQRHPELYRIFFSLDPALFSHVTFMDSLANFLSHVESPTIIQQLATDIYYESGGTLIPSLHVILTTGGLNWFLTEAVEAYREIPEDSFFNSTRYQMGFISLFNNVPVHRRMVRRPAVIDFLNWLGSPVNPLMYEYEMRERLLIPAAFQPLASFVSRLNIYAENHTGAPDGITSGLVADLEPDTIFDFLAENKRLNDNVFPQLSQEIKYVFLITLIHVKNAAGRKVFAAKLKSQGTIQDALNFIDPLEAPIHKISILRPDKKTKKMREIDAALESRLQPGDQVKITLAKPKPNGPYSLYNWFFWIAVGGALLYSYFDGGSALACMTVIGTALSIPTVPEEPKKKKRERKRHFEIIKHAYEVDLAELKKTWEQARQPGILSREQEVILFRALHASNIGNQQDDLRDFLVSKNDPLLIDIALRQGRLFKQAYYHGWIGLHMAVAMFNPEMGNKFSTYATYQILGWISNWQDSLRLKKYEGTLMQNLKEQFRRFTIENERKPSIEDLAVLTGYRPDVVKRLLLRAKGPQNIEWNTYDSKSHLDQPEQKNIYEAPELYFKVMKAFRILNRQEQTILKMLNAVGITLKVEPYNTPQVGAILGITKTRVGQININAISKLRTYFAPQRDTQLLRKMRKNGVRPRQDHKDVFLVERVLNGRNGKISFDSEFEQLLKRPWSELKSSTLILIGLGLLTYLVSDAHALSGLMSVVIITRRFPSIESYLKIPSQNRHIESIDGAHSPLRFIRIASLWQMRRERDRKAVAGRRALQNA